MLDYTKLGPANSPTPSTPTTTAPPLPQTPSAGSLAAPAPAGGASFGAGVPNLLGNSSATGAYPKGSINPDGSYHEATQAEINAMAPWDRFGHGLDSLGHALFGQGNGSLLGGVAGGRQLGQAIGMAGEAFHLQGSLAVAPFEAGATVLSHIPLGWVPGGADDTFNHIGSILKTQDPAMYGDWLVLKTRADADVLGGGNLKADFNIEYQKLLDDTMHDSFLGGTPELAMGRTGVGSLGGALSGAIKGFLGLGSNTVQGIAGNVSLLDPYYSGHKPGEGGSTNITRLLDIRDNPNKYMSHVGSSTPYSFNDYEKFAVENVTSGKWTNQQAQDWIDKNINTKLDRVGESTVRLDAGMEVSDVETKAANALKSGLWSRQHANDYIISHGQGVTRNPVGQIIGSAALDPLTYATLGAGSISKLGLTTGTRLITMAGEGASMAEKLDLATTTAEKLAVVVATVQKGEVSGPIFRITRGLFDPLAVYKPSSVARAVTDLKNGVAVESLMRSHGPQTIKDIRALAREHGLTTEIDSAMATYAMDKADEMVTMTYARDMLNEGLAEHLARTSPDDVSGVLAQNAGRDAVTELTDHMQRIMKNTFTAEEEVNLAGRMASVFGKDVPYWEKRLTTMSFNQRSALHAITYKRAEVGFEKARAAINQAMYDGTLTLRDAVLMSPETLDRATAEAIVANIRGALKNEAKSIEDPIATATQEWNNLTMRYGHIATIGHATGGKDQLETLVKELEKEIERGAISRSATAAELAHPALKPLRDFMARNSTTGEQRVVTAAELVAREKAAVADAQQALAQAGFTPVSHEKFFAAVTKAQKVVKSNGRSVGETVYRYPKGEYRHMKLWLSADGKAGFAIKADGDLVSVFNAGTEKGVIEKLVPHFHALGATKGDAFDETGRLPELYAKGGFKVTRREPWNPAYAPDGWKGGTPDVVYMEHPGMPKAPTRFHGSPDTGLSSASADPAARQFDNATSQFGAFTTTSRPAAERYAGTAGKVYGAEAELKNPFALTRKKFDYFQAPNKDKAGKALPPEQWAARAEELKVEAQKLRAQLEAQGYDGIEIPGNKGNPPETAHFSDVKLGAPDVMEATKTPLWKIGFRPKEEVAWGFKRDASTGLYTIDRAPTISHNVDAVPFGRQRFSDTTRNVLGQIIGPSKAESLTKPVESVEAYINTLRDGVTGQRLVKNIDQRFERSTFDAGIPKPISAAIMKRAKEVAGLDYSNVRGIKPENLWKEIHDIIPIDFRMANGAALDVHVVMDHLLQAAEGDFRIMGVTSALSQKARVALRHMPGPIQDGSNVSGQLTVGVYNKMRYVFNPMFVIQRVTDAPYYSVIEGIIPVGKGALSEANATLRAITENMGRTGLGRHFSMDMPEFATHSNFTEGIRSGFQQAGLDANKLTQIARAPDAIIANNMTNMLHARMGDIVEGALENLKTVAEQAADPQMRAEMLAEADRFRTNIDEITMHYNELAGRNLTRDEVGLQYTQDMLSGWRHTRVNPDGTLDHTMLLREGEWAVPNSIGEIQSFHPDDLAQEVGSGYADGAALRRDVTGHVEKVNGSFMLVKGEHDIPWLEEQLRTKMHLHPDVIKRALDYFGDTWDNYWARLAKPIDEGGLDISPHFAAEAQDIIAMEAKNRGMDPWEYMSGVMGSNIGGKGLDTHMGQLIEFLRAGKASQPLEEWTKVWRSHLDVSAQETLMQEFEKATGAVNPHIEPAQFEYVVPKSAPGAAPRPAVAALPKSFKVEPGYVYRVEKPGAAAGGIPDHIGVTTGKPTSFYNRNEGEAIFRVKEADVPGQIGPGRHIGGEDRLTVGHIPPEKTEMLGVDGVWHPMEADPYDNFFGNNFPQMVKERIVSGKPHPNPEVEGYMQALSKWVQDNIGAELGARTRSDLRDLVEKVPTTNAVNFNRTHGLVISLLKNKIQDAQQDVFRLAEMQTKRSVLERSLNHPLFGLYPSSYMWGKVLPESVKFLAKNPYAATYIINDVQRAIAVQREYDTDFDKKMSAVDNSSGAFLADYLTPSLPWSSHEARMSPLVRDIFNGKDPGAMWRDELATISPQRWVAQVVNTVEEIPGAVQSLQNEQAQQPALQSLINLPAPAGGAPAGGAALSGVDSSISGPTPAAALAPILADDLARLKELFVTAK